MRATTVREWFPTKGQHHAVKALAQTLNVDQSAVSKLEHRTDMYVSTLRQVFTAGGYASRLGAQAPGQEAN
jgi:hypothetical protein